MHITDHVFEETKIAGQSRCVADTHTIDQAEIKLDHSEPTIDPDMTKALNTATLEACPHGLCLALQDPLNQGAQQMSQHVQQSGHMLDLFIRLRWIDKTFKMKFARPRKC